MANIDALIRRAAHRWGVNPAILRAQLVQESGLRQNVTSNKGARDIAQFIPSTAAAYGVTLGDNNPADDINGAAHYMHDNLKATHGDYKAALSMYNSGRPDAYKDPNFAHGETANYVKKILGAAGGGPGAAAQPHTRPGSPTDDREITVPGTDNADLRKSLLLNYLENRHDPDALLSLASGLRGAQDTPDSTTTVPGPMGSPQAGPGGGHGRFKGDTLEELFWQGAGGIDVKDGKRVPQGFVDGHTDHVHLADDNIKNLIRAGKIAQRMGLHVGENSHFTGQRETAGHAPNSWHYQDRAIDVSGDPALMRKYAHRMARRFGVG